MLRLVEFEKKDLDNIQLRTHEQTLRFDYVDIIGQADRVGTIKDKEKVVCIIGIHGDKVWMLPSIYIKDYVVFVARQIRKIVKNYKYLVTMCLDDVLHNRWMRFLGFEPKHKVEWQGREYNIYERIA